MARPDRPGSAALDASAVIDYIKGENHSHAVSEILRAAELGQLQLVGATILIAEVRSGPRSEPADPAVDHRILTLLQDPRWLYVELDTTVGLQARKLGQELGLKPADAIHLASAVAAEAEVFLTGDRRFPIGAEVEGVWVDHPYQPGGPDLFTPDPHA